MELLEQNPEVLTRFAAGELAAFEVLFRKFQGEVYGWIVRVVRDPGTAEDLTVETFWRIYRARTRFDPSRSFGAWARRIATNTALDYLKSAEARKGQRDESLQVEFMPDRREGNPAIQQELRERTRQAFLQLPGKLRIVAILALIEERPQSEIAEALGVSIGTVKSRLFRAVRLLRRKLGNLDINHE